MKIKLLLFILLFTSILLNAQSPYKNLIITEIRIDRPDFAYVELTNMGSTTVDLAQFSVGNVNPWSYAPWDTIPDHTFSTTINDYINLPSKMLSPGESFVIANVSDWVKEMEPINDEKYTAKTKNDTWRLADMQIHVPEAPNRMLIPNYTGTDSVTVGYNTLTSWFGSACIYVCHHYTATDSAFVDAVNGIFTNEGQRPGGQSASDVAGVPDGTGNSILVRKHTVTNGTLDWEQARGVDITDSEWLPIPILVPGGWEVGRKEYWTFGNHGDYTLNASSIKSSKVQVDWTKLSMKVQWGVRNIDSIMNAFDYVPGIAWKYTMSPSKLDSAYTSVRTGDSLTLYACGNQLTIMKFGLELLAPTNSEARVMPKNANGGGNWYTPYIVTNRADGKDTIRNVPFATRVDSLFKYLEKPAKATWKILYSDNVERPDLINGDKLKITAENGTSTKEYYIKVTKYRPGHNATLASITWPDIPEYYKGIFGWMGDTIPAFSPTKYNYNLSVPYDANGIPALIAKAQDPDTRIEVTRATSLYSTEEAKTMTIYTVAEDDTSDATYYIRMEKEKDLVNVQPYSAEPFFSQFTFRADWRQSFIEICNPGNQPLDLSHYCIVRSNSTDPYQAITTASTDADWANRFNRYVPGYIWQDEANWQVQPGILEQDFAVNPIVEGGDVFVLAWAFDRYKDVATAYPEFDQIDVNFKNGFNPWGIEFAEEASGLASTAGVMGGWLNSDWILYKIVNDSVLDGTKPLIDPYDIEVIDVIGRCNGQDPGLMVAPSTNFNQNSGLKRLPQYYKGNPEPAGSFLDTLNNKPSEWLYTNDTYWSTRGYGWPQTNSMNSSGLGSHEMKPITEFISTVASGSYTVSKGYSLKETIGGGVQTGITVDEFMQSIIVADAAQKLTFMHGTTEISGSDVLLNGDVLTVVSANGENTTKYTINVTTAGLSNNALLTSTLYTVKVNGNTGTVEGFAKGTKLKTVFDGVKAPTTASLFGMFKADGSYASFKQMKYDSTYADVIATDKIYFEVIAQDGITKIDYQLKPTSATTDAYVLSDVYQIDQDAAVIALLLDGTNVNAFFKYLIPAPGATIQLQNKAGQVRDFGTIYKDDKLIVTAADGTTKKVYTLELWSQFALRYEAIMASDVYTVNQQTFKVTGVIKGTTVAQFLDSVIFSLGATYELKDKAGVAKTSTVLVDGDMVVVTSENGIVVRKYSIVLLKVSVNEVFNGNIKAYPNPTTGMINIDGLEDGNVIRIFNVVGNNVLTITAGSMKEKASLQNQPNGLYVVVVNDGAQQIARFKVIKK
ncbi:MAG: T9SS type A sorting domain-containing protein [Prolixibacteraceae bacterium]